ncbi:MAG: hypothetical protein ABIP20_16010 [Chthoniobacteraceae bacterium]
MKRLPSLILLLVFNPCLHATEFFVTKQERDTNLGTSREASFFTIQKGVEALQRGDALTTSKHAGHPVRLRFVMKSTDLTSFRFTP